MAICLLLLVNCPGRSGSADLDNNCFGSCEVVVNRVRRLNEFCSSRHSCRACRIELVPLPKIPAARNYNYLPGVGMAVRTILVIGRDRQAKFGWRGSSRRAEQTYRSTSRRWQILKFFGRIWRNYVTRRWSVLRKGNWGSGHQCYRYTAPNTVAFTAQACIRVRLARSLERIVSSRPFRLNTNEATRRRDVV